MTPNHKKRFHQTSVNNINTLNQMRNNKIHHNPLNLNKQGTNRKSYKIYLLKIRNLNHKDLEDLLFLLKKNSLRKIQKMSLINKLFNLAKILKKNLNLKKNQVWKKKFIRKLINQIKKRLKTRNLGKTVHLSIIAKNQVMNHLTLNLKKVQMQKVFKTWLRMKMVMN